MLNTLYEAVVMELNRVTRIDDLVGVRNVLISVSDKRNLKALVEGLLSVNHEVRIFSTGGTYRAIADILMERTFPTLISISEYTAQPEMQGGLVKTLDFKIYMGILSETYNEAHQADLSRTGAVSFDMVVVNLYPFIDTVQKPGITPEDGRTNIDIGGPCMLRASAKNYLRVCSVCDPDDYAALLSELAANRGKISLKTRYGLAKKSFKHTAAYDAAISQYFESVDFETIASTYTMQ